MSEDKIKADARALRIDATMMRLQVAGCPRLLRPLIRWALGRVVNMCAWVERKARNGR